MKQYLLLVAFALVSGALWADNFDSTRVVNTAEIRAGATFTKYFDHHINLALEEEIRSQVYNSYQTPAYFNRSYTSVSLSYKPITYLSMHTGYTLRLLGNHGWTDPKEFMRHRGTFALTGHYKTRDWSFSLRERLDLDGRMDSVNTNEKNVLDLRLRHRFYASYSIPGRPLKVFGAVELINTLNQPFAYVNKQLSTSYGQYLSDARLQVGVKWRLDKTNALNFSYRFAYTKDYDINITKKKGYVELYRETGFEHVIGVNYEFDW